MLYLITNRKLVRKGLLHDVIREAIDGGVDVVILREKDLSRKELLSLAWDIKKIIKTTCTRLIVNSDIEVARAINADGYHTGFAAFNEEKNEFHGLLGVSVHSVEEAMEAERLGASYLLASHLFETDCKKGLPPKGVQFIKDIKNRVSIPVIGLGGITPVNCAPVLAAGADGIAVMSAIMKAKFPKNLAQEYKRAYNIF